MVEAGPPLDSVNTDVVVDVGPPRGSENTDRKSWFTSSSRVVRTSHITSRTATPRKNNASPPYRRFGSIPKKTRGVRPALLQAGSRRRGMCSATPPQITQDRTPIADRPAASCAAIPRTP